MATKPYAQKMFLFLHTRDTAHSIYQHGHCFWFELSNPTAFFYSFPQVRA